MPPLDQLTDFLDRLLDGERIPDEIGGIYVPSTRAITRLGLALEPWPGLAAWADTECLDALFLHRPWKLDPATLAADVGVVAYHRAFDERLTLGFNPHLAAALEMTGLETLGLKDGRPIGMLGTIPKAEAAAYCRRLQAVFAGSDGIFPGARVEAARIAVVGAMTDALVREAAERRVDLYVTGQWRQPGASAVKATGIGVVVVGHRRSEEWGLRMLARLLEERWPDLRVVLPSPG